MSTVRAKFRPSRAVLVKAAQEASGSPRAATRPRADRLARMLALAHHIERLIEAGEVASYGEVGRALGLSQPRISQIMALLWLSPTIQECILLGKAGLGIRAAMRAAGNVEWRAQDPERAC